jgi:hypothetical protein
MLCNHEYVAEKLRSFRIETLNRASSLPSTPRRRSTLVRPVASAGGRFIRRLGESIERLASPEPGYASSHDLEPCTDCP